MTAPKWLRDLFIGEPRYKVQMHRVEVATMTTYVSWAPKFFRKEKDALAFARELRRDNCWATEDSYPAVFLTDTTTGAIKEI